MDPTNELWEMDRGELRIRREMARAERARRRWRVRAVAAVFVLAAIVTAGGIAAAASASTGVRAKSLAVTNPTSRPDLAASPATTVDDPEQIAPSTEVAEIEPQPETPTTSERSPAVITPQRITIGIGGSGYEPSEPQASAGRSIVLVVEQGEGCAAGFYMPSLEIEADNSSGPVTLELGTLKPDTYMFTCGMGMIGGQLVVR